MAGSGRRARGAARRPAARSWKSSAFEASSWTTVRNRPCWVGFGFGFGAFFSLTTEVALFLACLWAAAAAGLASALAFSEPPPPNADENEADHEHRSQGDDPPSLVQRLLRFALGLVDRLMGSLSLS